MITDLITLERPLICLDVETTGFYPTRDRVIQIGVVRVKPDGSVDEKSILLDPEIPIPEASTKVHQITDAHVQGKKKFREIAVQFGIALAESDLCGFNITFDLGFLREEFKRCHVVFKHGKIIDAYRIFSRKEARTLIAARSFYLGETETPDAHDALGDAKATLRVVRAQLLKYGDLPRSVDKLHQEFFETPQNENALDPEGKFVWRGDEVVCNFGKLHFGKSLKDLAERHSHYLKWITEAQFSPAVKKIAGDALQGKFPQKEVASS